ncbi:MAG: amidophosphoribosyltransferase [Spirochaetes bacterium]|nr:amidophosphoribosyltransferase [Spirochaetota bacterium]
MEDRTDAIRHHCGVMGISAEEDVNLPELLFYGLFSLQHRGQESAGIAYHRHGRIVSYRDVGMVASALSHYLKENHPSRVGIGHVRYSTHGTNKLENAQPIVVSCNKGEISLAHNGNLSNSDELTRSLIAGGSIFQSTTDTELLLHLIARSPRPDFRGALLDCLGLIEGAYCFLVLHGDTLFAVRDPLGFRPLVIGRRDGMVMVASETCALGLFQPEEIREVEPGEILEIQGSRITSSRLPDRPATAGRRAHCIFELIYFARPDSEVFGHSVHLVRKRMGAMIARDDPSPGDLVIPVPDSGSSAALGYANASGVELEHGLTRNHYMGRTFIQPTPALRELGVRMKLHPVRQAIAGRRITVIDDSLVRGTTSRQMVRLLREAGAREVHLRLSSPPLRFPCFFGIDIPTREELIANRLEPDGIAREIGADSVRFLSLEALRGCVDRPDDYCTACFSGEYPCPVMDAPVHRTN